MTSYDADNIFARMIAGEIPAHKVHEDDDVLVIMDVFPQSRGHTLVIPKAGARNLLDADPKVLGKIMPTVQRVARAVFEATGADGFRLVQFNETAAGQTVFHLHFHIIPVYEGETMGRHAAGARADDAELAALAKRIGAQLS